MIPGTCRRCGTIDVPWARGHAPTCDAPVPRVLRGARRAVVVVLLSVARAVVALAAVVVGGAR